MSKIIFVTGTDTGVGKTVAAATLVCFYREQRKKVAYIKPIQTGAPKDNDALTVRELTGINTGDVHTLLSYKPPMAPEQAAKTSKAPLPKLKKLISQIKDIALNYDVVIVEGAGGLYVPIDEKHYMLDLCKQLRAQIVVVARTGLGTINHTLLTVKALQSKRIKILGILFSANSNDPSAKNNPQVIAEKTGLPILGVIPRQKKINIKICIRSILRPIV
jgi:dethiobiotin synthetase